MFKEPGEEGVLLLRNFFDVKIHYAALLSLSIIVCMIPRIPLLISNSILSLSLLCLHMSFFELQRQKRNTFLSGRTYWYIILFYSMFFMKILTSNIVGININNVVWYIISILLIFVFASSFLWQSKNKFSNFIHILNIVIISTYVIIELSEIFNFYYAFMYDVDILNYYGRGRFLIKPFIQIKFSLRCFFELPPDEYLDIVTFFQFVIGRLYEALIIGSVVSGLVNIFISRKADIKNTDK